MLSLDNYHQICKGEQGTEADALAAQGVGVCLHALE